MVIKDILDKVSNADPNDPKVKQLREKLAKLKGEDPKNAQKKQQKPDPVAQAPAPGDHEQRKKPVAQDKKAAPQAPEDEIEQLAKASEQERRRYAQDKNPRLRVKDERTHKLVAKQVGELIELTTELQKRLTKQEQENKNLHQEIERVQKRNDEIKEKMELIDGRLEKFMGLYEVITNQYNPFAEQDSAAQTVPDQVRDNTNEIASGKQTVSVSDGLKGEEQHVPIEQGEMSSENKQKINQLLAELEAQENQEISENQDQVQESEVREEQLSQQLREELHSMFGNFEERMKQYLDESVQSKLHQTLGDLENVLNDEIEEAVAEQVDSLKGHDDIISGAFEELAQLESDSKDSEAYHQAEQEVEDEVQEIDEQIKAIPPSLYFRLKDGQVLKSKQDLAQALQDMDASVFNHHVNDTHNDFADWLELALEDPLGADLRGKTREEMAQLLSD